MPTLTKDQLTAAKEWLSDCVWTNMEPEDFEALPDDRIVRAVHRYFEGGIWGFLATTL